MSQEELIAEVLTTLQYLVQLLSQGTKLDIEATLPTGVTCKLHFTTSPAEPARKVVRRRRAKAAATEPAE